MTAFIYIDNSVTGPLTRQEIQDKLNRKAIVSTDLVCPAGSETWITVADFLQGCSLDNQLTSESESKAAKHYILLRFTAGIIDFVLTFVILNSLDSIVKMIPSYWEIPGWQRDLFCFSGGFLYLFCRESFFGRSVGKLVCFLVLIDSKTNRPVGLYKSFLHNLGLLIPLLAPLLVGMLSTGLWGQRNSEIAIGTGFVAWFVYVCYELSTGTAHWETWSSTRVIISKPFAKKH